VGADVPQCLIFRACHRRPSSGWAVGDRPHVCRCVLLEESPQLTATLMADLQTVSDAALTCVGTVLHMRADTEPTEGQSG
jgi:hypothetical protein